MDDELQLGNVPVVFSVFRGAPFEYTVSVTGGTPPYSYKWTKQGSSEVISTTDTLSLPDFDDSDAGEYTITVGDTTDAKVAASFKMEVIERYNIKWTIHPIPWRNTSFTYLWYWVWDELLAQKAAGKDWKKDHATYKYKDEVETLLDAFNLYGEVEIQETRNGYIHKLSSL